MHHFIYNHIFTQNVTSYAEAFLPVQSDSQTSARRCYFENGVQDNGGYIMDSLWTDTVNIRSHKPLAHGIKTSALIIGGGNKTGKCTGGYSNISSFAEKHYPEAA